MYKVYSPAAIVFVIWNLLIKESNYDINISHDKREIFIRNEVEILPVLKDNLSKFFEYLKNTKAFAKSKE